MYKGKRIFVSFHHEKNQKHAEIIRNLVKLLGHIDISVNEGTKVENEEYKTDESIRKEIRDKFLRNVDVTIVIVGAETIHRKHIDWEIRSTIHKFDQGRDGAIVVVNTVKNYYDIHTGQKEIYTWILDKELIKAHDFFSSDRTRKWPNQELVNLSNFEWLPPRLAKSIVDKYDYESSMQGVHNHAVFPIISYERVKERPIILQLAIKQALDYKNRNRGKWDINTKMRRQNNERFDRKIYEQVES